MPPTPKTPTNNPLATGDQLLTVAEVASFLRVSTTAVYALCHSGQLPHHKFGCGKKIKTMRVNRIDLEKFLRDSREEGLQIEAPTPRAKPRAARHSAGAGATILRSLGYDPSRVN